MYNSFFEIIYGNGNYFILSVFITVILSFILNWTFLGPFCFRTIFNFSFIPKTGVDNLIFWYFQDRFVEFACIKFLKPTRSFFKVIYDNFNKCRVQLFSISSRTEVDILLRFSSGPFYQLPTCKIVKTNNSNNASFLQNNFHNNFHEYAQLFSILSRTGIITLFRFFSKPFCQVLTYKIVETL